MDATTTAAPPLLVVLLAGNSVTAVSVLACLCMADARALRCVQPAIAAVVRMVSWTDDATPVTDVIRWRAALPAAVGVTLRRLENKPAATAALAGLASLCVAGCSSYAGITDETLARMPVTLRVLDVTHCFSLTRGARFDHLIRLDELTCTSTAIVEGGVTKLPPSLRVLRMDKCTLPAAANFSHLVALRVLSGINCSNLGSLPPSLQELDLSWPGCERIREAHMWPPGTPLAHLTQLRVLIAPRRSLNDAALAALPPSITVLDVTECPALTPAASFAHLRQLRTLRAMGTMVSGAAIATLPSSLQEADVPVSQSMANYLHAGVGTWPRGVWLTHMAQLRVLNAARRAIDDAALLALPPSLTLLDVTECGKLTPVASFAHLLQLHTLRVTRTAIGDATIAALPPSLVTLHATECYHLTPAAALPALPVLRELDVGGSSIGDATIASMPPGLTHLCLAYCGYVTRGATFDHLVGLQMLQSSGTDVSPDVLAAYRARGCWVPAAGVLRGLDTLHRTFTLAALPDGRLACCEQSDGLTLWDYARGEGAIVKTAVRIRGIAKAVATRYREHWGVRGEEATICVGITYPHDDDSGAVAEVAVDDVSNDTLQYFYYRYGVSSVAILPDNRMAAGRLHGSIVVVLHDENQTAIIDVHGGEVVALAVLPDGTLASGSLDCTVAIINVTTNRGLIMAGHSAGVRALAVLPDGTLASGSDDASVRLWHTAHRICIGVLAAGAPVTALAVTTGGQLAAGCDDGTIRVWEARPSSRDLVCAPSRVFAAHRTGVTSLVPLPDGRLASVAYSDTVRLWCMPPPPAR